jgi:hypothetical protein
MPEAKALQQALHKKGVSAFLCDIPPGQDLANAVVTALTHCKMAVILGTETYGRKTDSGFSTFEELRYIQDENKPYFLVKMCPSFEEAETRFRLPTSISYFPWQPTAAAERERVPAALLTQLMMRLDSVVHGHSGYVAPPVATRPAPHGASGPTSRSGSSASASAPPTPRMAAASDASGASNAELELSQWLSALNLNEFEPVLRRLGADDARDVKVGFAEGVITIEALQAEGMKMLRATRLRREAENLVCG